MKTRSFAAALLALLSAILAISTVASARAAVVVDTTSQGCARPASSVAVTHRAGLVVTFGDHSTKKFCIEFSADTISGLELLQRSGLTLVTSGTGGLGSAVCSIDGEGSSDPTNCFASCSGGTCAYWAYYRYVNAAWQFSQAGASQTAVHDGDVQGWAWGSGGTSTGAVPAPPGEICPHITSTPTWTPVPSAPAITPIASQAQPTAPATTEASAPPAVVTNIPTTTDVPPPLPATDEPSQAPAAPAPSEQSAVEGEVRSPTRETTTASAATPTPIATPKSGAIVIGEDQGIQNQAHSESRKGGTGGSSTALILFGIVAGMLVVAAGGILYWRRRAV